MSRSAPPPILFNAGVTDISRTNSRTSLPSRQTHDVPSRPLDARENHRDASLTLSRATLVMAAGPSVPDISGPVWAESSP